MGRLFHFTIKEMIYREEDAVTTRPGWGWTEILLYIGRDTCSQGIAVSLKPSDEVICWQLSNYVSLGPCDLIVMDWVYAGR
jgi:hypothetical protein